VGARLALVARKILRVEVPSARLHKSLGDGGVGAALMRPIPVSIGRRGADARCRLDDEGEGAEVEEAAVVLAPDSGPSGSGG
jgi:hypothetical protein